MRGLQYTCHYAALYRLRTKRHRSPVARCTPLVWCAYNTGVNHISHSGVILFREARPISFEHVPCLMLIGFFCLGCVGSRCCTATIWRRCMRCVGHKAPRRAHGMASSHWILKEDLWESTRSWQNKRSKTLAASRTSRMWLIARRAYVSAMQKRASSILRRWSTCLVLPAS